MSKKSPLDSGDNGVVLLLGELAAETWLPGREGRVLPQSGKQCQLFGEHFASSLFELSSRAGFVLRVTFRAFQAYADGCVHT